MRHRRLALIVGGLLVLFIGVGLALLISRSGDAGHPARGASIAPLVAAMTAVTAAIAARRRRRDELDSKDHDHG